MTLGPVIDVMIYSYKFDYGFNSGSGDYLYNNMWDYYDNYPSYNYRYSYSRSTITLNKLCYMCINDFLYCSSDVGTNVYYQWTNVESGNTTFGQFIHPTSFGNFTYQCTASASYRGYINRVSKSISVTVGPCRKYN